MDRELQRIDGVLLRAPVPQATREPPEGMVHRLVAASVARRPPQRRRVEGRALHAQHEPLEPAGGEGDAAVGGAERRVARQRRLVQVEELVDVMSRHGERRRGDEASHCGVQGSGERDQRQVAAVSGPQPVGRHAEQAAAPVVEQHRFVVDGERGGEGDVAVLVGGDVDDRHGWGVGQLHHVARVLTDELDADVHRPFELVPDVGAEAGQRRRLGVRVAEIGRAAGHERPQRRPLQGVDVVELVVVGGGEVAPRGARLDPPRRFPPAHRADRDPRAGGRREAAGRRVHHGELEGQPRRRRRDSTVVAGQLGQGPTPVEREVGTRSGRWVSSAGPRGDER